MPRVTQFKIRKDGGIILADKAYSHYECVDIHMCTLEILTKRFAFPNILIKPGDDSRTDYRVRQLRHVRRVKSMNINKLRRDFHKLTLSEIENLIDEETPTLEGIGVYPEIIDTIKKYFEFVIGKVLEGYVWECLESHSLSGSSLRI